MKSALYVVLLLILTALTSVHIINKKCCCSRIKESLWGRQ
jgi:hypothetical protein